MLLNFGLVLSSEKKIKTNKINENLLKKFDRCNLIDLTRQVLSTTLSFFRGCASVRIFKLPLSKKKDQPNFHFAVFFLILYL